MRLPIRCLSIVTLVAGCPYDPATPEYDVITDTDGSSSGAETLSSTIDPSEPTTEGPTTPSTTAVDTTDADTTGNPGVCGDGEIGGAEVCDDGTNDGSYGGCMPDCAALGPSCGDAAINGAEVCDDGTNDGSYGGCAAGCKDLGPYCGDGDLQDPELCDTGDSNQNGSGCNVDCVTSGTVVGTYLVGGLSFCDGSFVTPPVFRADGNALVSASGYCNDDSVLLAELSPQVELVQEFGDLLLPQTPVREATLAGDNWLLASYGCTYAVTPMGELTEACDPRIAGGAGLAARDDGSYVALDYEVFASYPAGSPSDGDVADWQVPAPDNAVFDYSYYAAAIGPSDSAIVVGSRRQLANNAYLGYLVRHTAAGNEVGSLTYAGVEQLERVAVGSGGDVAVSSGYPTYRVMRLAADFSEDWGLDVPSSSDVLIGVDSTGAVVMGYVDAVTNGSVLRKWTANGATELWSIEVESAGYGARLAIAPDDSIWIASASGNGFGVARISP